VKEEEWGQVHFLKGFSGWTNGTLESEADPMPLTLQCGRFIA
jgi:hypothetical protein